VVIGEASAIGDYVRSYQGVTLGALANYLVKERHAHYHFTVKGNQRGLLQDLALLL
jgi:serine acetyltransferase